MALFTPPQPGQPLSLMRAICSSIIPIAIVLLHQPFIVFGIFGLPSSWWDVLTLDLDIEGMIEEGTIRSFVSIVGTFLAFFRPTIPTSCPKWLRELFPLIAWLLYSDEATVNKPQGGKRSPETFVYVNGICTTKRMAISTGAELSEMFNKDVTVVHNATDSMVVDLFECLLGKLWTGKNASVSEPVELVYNEVSQALQDANKTKVVLIAHSQGTIIASDVLWKLWEDVENNNLPETAMRKLEIYAVANASQWMKQKSGFPYIESICNNYDNVGMLGANAPKKTKDTWNISIAGKVIYPVKPKWGHMISSHYLKYLKKGDYPNSKLHKYIEEATPAN